MKNHKTIIFGLSLATAIVIGFQLVNTLENVPINRVAQTSPELLAKLPQPQVVSSRLLIGGDIFLGRSVEKTALSDNQQFGAPFKKLNTFEKENYQAWIANLECPVTNTLVPIYEQENLLRFNCLVDFLPELAKWFDVVSLANNHTDNVNGQSGLLETRVHLEENNIQYFGHFDNSLIDDICEIITVDALLSYDNGSIEPTQIPIVFCGIHGVFRIPLDEELEVIKKYAEYLPVIAMPHMGAEYQASQDEIRTRAYRKMIDYGVDIVAGGHPHWVQNTESYNGKLIAYSLGNLIFDQQFSAEVKRSLLLDVTLNIDFNQNTAEWLSIAPSCIEFGDDCLELAKNKNLTKLDVDFSIDILASQNPDMLAQKADTATYQAVYNRAKWDETQELLNY